MEQRLIITDSYYDVNEYLNQGWKILSVTPQHVSTGGGSHLRGNFAIVLEKTGSFPDSDKPVTYTEEEVSKILEMQRGNCYVALYNATKDGNIAMIATNAPEPGQWRKGK